MATAVLDIETLHLDQGAHASRREGVCLLEAVAWFAGEKHSDHPACVCPTLATFLRSWNDGLPDAERQQLKQYIPRVVGTAGDGNTERRAWMAFDWLVRVHTPAWLELAKLGEHAEPLRNLPEILDETTLQGALPFIDAAWAAARDAARAAAWDAARAAAGAAAWDAARAAAGAAARAAAWDAARDAAWDAAWDAARAAAGAAARAAAWDAAWDAARAAAWDAAWDAARAAAWDAARAAARDAAWDAARAAAWDAAGAALKPTRDTLILSAHDLLDRMLALPRKEAA